MASEREKTALVTGGSRGIGRAVCLELARAGYYVAVNYRSDQTGAEMTLQQIREAGAAGEVIAFDVRDESLSRAAVEDLTAKKGSIDVLVNNAGIAADELFIMMTKKRWDSVIDTGLNGFYNLTRPVMEKALQQPPPSCAAHLIYN